MSAPATHHVTRLLIDNKAFLALALLVAVSAGMSDNFLTLDNTLNVLRQTSINAIIAMGVTFVILTAGIDLSVGAVLALTGAFAASMTASGLAPWLSVPGTVAAGAALGAISGLFVAYGRVQAFIVTLVAMTILRGAALVFTDGRPIAIGASEAADTFWLLGGGYWFGVPIPIYLMFFVFVLCWSVLHHTRFGRHVYAVGGGEKVARLSGINVNRIKISVYAISGACAALAGVVLTARLGSAQPTAGTGYELDAIAAVVIGGTSLMGGRGRIFGTLIGALVIGVLNNALNIMGVSSYYQMIAKGAVILLAVLIDSRSQSSS
ncbi:ribose ABC transporter membrane protein [Modicisalibacter ilicicola DSM 19980]|uniref:Ribose ABC transporter membrane protein n=1 Tax=Modicisalibacter ilicicola DSM 19980 TaxID=1121942 RepID=A0A1M5EW94_9GAMM|nr:ribose ABC transporter permease [Halomonas ilicicola]SHF83477.1 ribose ABC transporter membrane protein [Halomonas ilicicola DSM 19980]